jgi:hypothetical protein
VNEAGKLALVELTRKDEQINELESHCAQRDLEGNHLRSMIGNKDDEFESEKSNLVIHIEHKTQQFERDLGALRAENETLCKQI